jgi:hypothetical protein
VVVAIDAELGWTSQLRDTLAHRAEYLQLIHRRDEVGPDGSSGET